MSASRRFARLDRQVEKRAPKQKIVIFTEGQLTEQEYFRALARAFCGVVLEIEIIGGAGVPATIARKATELARVERHKNRRQSYAKRDEFWAVFDRDEHPNVDDAVRQCEDGRVGVAFSDPCFEVWLILHFEDFHRPDNRHEVQRYLESICSDYDRTKRKTTDCNRLIEHVIAAEGRAEVQLQRRREEGEPPGPPFTTVYQLTRRIRAGSNGK